jgi:dsDNA-specific endonuclease/ATPase MutS2
MLGAWHHPLGSSRVYDRDWPNGSAAEPVPHPAVNPFDEPFRISTKDVLDLHSVSPRDVIAVVEEYLNEANRLNFKALRIIHGRGIGVQREAVRKVLAATPFVADFRDAPADAGGWGATIVTLR